MAEGDNLSPILSWFTKNGKPLTAAEEQEIGEKFRELDFEVEDLALAEDDDLKILVPETWCLTKQWALKRALKEFRGKCFGKCQFNFFFSTTSSATHCLFDLYL